MTRSTPRNTRPSQSGLARRTALAAGLALSALSPAAFAGPPGDYGDAPVGNNGDGIVAYNGVLARWVSFYTHKNTVFMPTRSRGTWTDEGADFRLGTIAPPTKLDTAQDPTAADNDANPVWFYTTPGPNPLGRLELKVSADASYNPSDPVYLNVLIDQNRDGQWKDGFFVGTQLFAWNMEWAVQDLELYLTPGDETEVGISNIRLEDPAADHWIRLVLTDRPVGKLNKGLPSVPGSATFWDGSMVDASSQSWVGEIEDHLLTPGGNNPNFPPGSLNPNIVLLPGGNPPNPKPRCIIGFEGLDVGATTTTKLATPWCQNGRRPFQWQFSSVDVLGGCDSGNAPALLGLYGPKLLAGRGNRPLFDGLNGAGGPLACADGTNLELPAQAGTGYPKFDEGTYTIAQLEAGINDRVCYPDPRKFRLYGVKVRVETCGSEYQSYTLHPPSIIGEPSIVAGTESIAMFFAGDLIQEYIDITDDHFTNWTFAPILPGGSIAIDTNIFAQGGSSLRIIEGVYQVTPNLDNIPPTDGLRPEVDLSFLKLGQVRFMHLGGDANVTLVAEDGEAFTTTVPPSLDEFQSIVIDVPDGFAVQDVIIEMFDGWIDELEIEVCEREDDASNCPADLTGSSDPLDPTYGQPDGDADGDDFFFYLDAFSAGETQVCDLTGTSDPNSTGYGDPDGDCDGDDFFFYLDLFAAGCEG